jgi:Fur family ferric uptake transcriptional regulator
VKRATNYKTKQLDAVLDYVAAHSHAHVTAAQIVEHFEANKIPVGRTTIYRNLDKLTETGQIRKYITDGISGACYQYAQCDNTHFHLKCEGCGALRHFECSQIHGLQRHLSDKHDFRINTLKTVFYGTCDECYSPHGGAK